jgi:prepilin-type N-terminal cleavage/methylation domain-containing protein
MNQKGKMGETTRQGNEGYTLIELMISLCILAIGILGICTMQVAAIHGNATARKVTQCATLGADEFEKIMNMSYDDALLTPGSTTTRTDGIYTVTWQVSAKDTPIRNMKTVTITASWTVAGQQRSVSYVYYKSAFS